ncbi:hypothetical protein QM996_13750 [Sinorhizobium chiapasense]
MASEASEVRMLVVDSLTPLHQQLKDGQDVVSTFYLRDREFSMVVTSVGSIDVGLLQSERVQLGGIPDDHDNSSR